MDQLEKNNMVVKNLGINDVENAKRIYKESFKKDSVRFNNHFLNIFGVYKNGLLGLCQIDYIDNCFEHERIAFINSVCVDSKYRNMGVATYLLTEIEKIVRENGCNSIMLTSSSKRKIANHLYERLGFVVYNTNVFKKKI